MARILVVDRDPSTLRAFRALLEQDGHHVDTCEAHDGAIERLQHHPYEGVISEVGHSPRGGVRLTRAARRSPHAPCVFLMCASEPTAQLRQAAPCLILPKPVDYALIHAAITSCRSCAHCRGGMACHVRSDHDGKHR